MKLVYTLAAATAAACVLLNRADPVRGAVLGALLATAELGLYWLAHDWRARVESARAREELRGRETTNTDIAFWAMVHSEENR